MFTAKTAKETRSKIDSDGILSYMYCKFKELKVDFYFVSSRNE